MNDKLSQYKHARSIADNVLNEIEAIGKMNQFGGELKINQESIKKLDDETKVNIIQIKKVLNELEDIQFDTIRTKLANCKKIQTGDTGDMAENISTLQNIIGQIRRELGKQKDRLQDEVTNLSNPLKGLTNKVIQENRRNQSKQKDDDNDDDAM